MDCYIIRIYRQTEQGEITGLVERVGDNASGRPFSGYSGLIDTMRDDLRTDSSDTTSGFTRTDPGLRIVHSAKRNRT